MGQHSTDQSLSVKGGRKGKDIRGAGGGKLASSFDCDPYEDPQTKPAPKVRVVRTVPASGLAGILASNAAKTSFEPSSSPEDIPAPSFLQRPPRQSLPASLPFSSSSSSISKDPVVEVTTYYNNKINQLSSDKNKLEAENCALKGQLSTSNRNKAETLRKLEEETKKRKQIEEEFEAFKKKKFKFTFTAGFDQAQEITGEEEVEGGQSGKK